MAAMNIQYGPMAGQTRTEFFVKGDPYMDPLSGYQIYMIVRDLHTRKITKVARPIIMETLEEGAVAPIAATLTFEAVQQLADSLWDAGVRPRQAQQGYGELGATRAHLGDMKALLWHKMGVK